MITELEYICEILLGEPNERKGNGESNWDCPQCGSEKFHTMPHKEAYKDRFKCWSCQFWGDAYDLLRHLYPQYDYSWQRVRIAFWKEDYQREVKPEDRELENTNNPPRTGSAKTMKVVKIYGDNENDTDEQGMIGNDEFCPESDQAIKELLEYMDDPPSIRALCEMLRLCQKTLEICAKHRLHPAGFAGRCGAVVGWQEFAEQHMAECEDTDCDFECCERNWNDLPAMSRVTRNGKA